MRAPNVPCRAARATPLSMKTIVVLISGRGSNMLALARACRDERWPARIAAVVSSREDAPGLACAREAGLHAVALDHRAYADRDAYDAALAECIDAHAPDLVALAGFMRVLGSRTVARYAMRLMNVHPSLLPAFPGLHTHRRALERGVRVHGATVHLVGDEVDAGPIVAQAAVPVLPDDTEHTLAERVLRAEHRLYPMAVRWFVEDRLVLADGRVRLLDARDDESQSLWAA